MSKKAKPSKGPNGWHMVFAWCPPEDSPLLGATPNNHADDESSRGPRFEQGEVTRRYDRMAWLYDIYNAPMEWLGTRRRRRRLISRAAGQVLEVGMGTGKNLGYYPSGVDLTGIDVSKAMLDRARRRAARLGIAVTLVEADVTALPFPDDYFDTSVATCVFCSVADPIAGLTELGRVTKPDGQILLLEHVRPRNSLLGRFADLATVFTRRVFGFRANRRTEANVARAGLAMVEVNREGVWREILAGVPAGFHPEIAPDVVE